MEALHCLTTFMRIMYSLIQLASETASLTACGILAHGYFQEQLLSKRLLYFTNQRLFLECKDTSWMDDSPDTNALAGWRPQQGSSSLLALAEITGSNKTVDTAQVAMPYEWYVEWIEHCTTRNFTKTEDRVSALEGLVSVVSASINGKYQRGLWTNDLERGLLWSLEFGQPPQLAPGPRCQTWTWERWQDSIEYIHIYHLALANNRRV